MPNAVITAPTDTQSGNFNVAVAFGVDVEDFTAANVDISGGPSGNGDTDVLITVSGSGQNYNVFFDLPDDVIGGFTIALTGNVTVSGAAEAITATAKAVTYDNRSTINATWGPIDYQEDGVIEVPVTFAQAVCYMERSNINLQRVSGTNTVFEVSVHQDSTNAAIWYVRVRVPIDTSGAFSLNFQRRVLLCPDVHDDVTIDPLTVNYGYITPFILDSDIPNEYVVGENFDIKMAFNTKVTGIANNNIQDVFILEGANLGTPDAYRWVGTSVPNIHDKLPDTLPAEWTLLPSLPTLEEVQYLLIRFANITIAEGVFNMTLRSGTLRGTVR